MCAPRQQTHLLHILLQKGMKWRKNPFYAFLEYAHDIPAHTHTSHSEFFPVCVCVFRPLGELVVTSFNKVETREETNILCWSYWRWWSWCRLPPPLLWGNLSKLNNKRWRAEKEETKDWTLRSLFFFYKPQLNPFLLIFHFLEFKMKHILKKGASAVAAVGADVKTEITRFLYPSSLHNTRSCHNKQNNSRRSRFFRFLLFQPKRRDEVVKTNRNNNRVLFEELDDGITKPMLMMITTSRYF